MKTNNDQREKSYLLSHTGLLIQSGRAKEMAFEYDRRAVPSVRRFLRLKEHDRYLFGDDKVRVEIMLADYGYAGVVLASVVDFEKHTEKTTVLTTPLSLGSLELPATPEWGDVIFRSGAASIDFSRSTGKRYIRGRIERFDDVRSLYVNVVLEQRGWDEFCSAQGRIGEPECFRLEHKIMDMNASGTVVYGADTYNLLASDSFACLDWQRAVLAPKGESCWFSAQGLSSDQTPFAFSFSGQRDMLCPDVNTVIYDGTAYNPGDIKIYQGKEKNEGKTILRSTNGRLELTFTPVTARRAQPGFWKLGFAHSELTYGRWNGRIKVGSNKQIDVKNVLGIAENQSFRW